MDFNFLISFLGFLIKYNLYQTILSIIFSLVIVGFYYFFWTRKNIKELKTEYENKILKERFEFQEEKSKLKDQYQRTIETLNNKIADKDKEIQELKLENVKLNSQHYTDYQLREYSRRNKNE